MSELHGHVSYRAVRPQDLSRGSTIVGACSFAYAEDAASSARNINSSVASLLSTPERDNSQHFVFGTHSSMTHSSPIMQQEEESCHVISVSLC